MPFPAFVDESVRRTAHTYMTVHVPIPGSLAAAAAQESGLLDARLAGWGSAGVRRYVVQGQNPSARKGVGDADGRRFPQPRPALNEPDRAGAHAHAQPFPVGTAMTRLRSGVDMAVNRARQVQSHALVCSAAMTPAMPTLPGEAMHKNCSNSGFGTAASGPLGAGQEQSHFNPG